MTTPIGKDPAALHWHGGRPVSSDDTPAPWQVRVSNIYTDSPAVQPEVTHRFRIPQRVMVRDVVLQAHQLGGAPIPAVLESTATATIMIDGAPFIPLGQSSANIAALVIPGGVIDEFEWAATIAIRNLRFEIPTGAVLEITIRNPCTAPTAPNAHLVRVLFSGEIWQE